MVPHVVLQPPYAPTQACVCIYTHAYTVTHMSTYIFTYIYIHVYTGVLTKLPFAFSLPSFSKDKNIGLVCVVRVFAIVF